MAEKPAGVLESTEVPKVEITRYESLPKPLKVICLILFAFGIGLFVIYIFGWFIGGWVIETVRYYYFLYAVFSTCVFLTLPMRKKDRTRLPWYDIILAAFVFGTMIYFSTKTWEIIFIGLVPPATTLDVVLACAIIVLAIEGGRRMAGTAFTVVVVIFLLYPLFAEYMPGFLYGRSYSVDWLVGFICFGGSGFLGLPAQVVGTLLLGFLIFAGVLIALGGGRFFLNLALGMLGHFRGGPAKVAVLASGFFGSLSGSIPANIVTTGSLTIPAMKRLGYPAHYAGAIEAVASTGGVIMPPVMGAIAFVIVIMTDIPYAVVLMGALIPALLYYSGLLIQVDAYAARVGLKGMPREQIPPILKTLKEGWPILAVLVFLVFGLIYMRWDVRAPVYASALMLLLSFTSRKTMMTPRRLVATLATVGNLVSYIMAVLLPIGIIMVSVGVTGAFAAGIASIVNISGASPVILLLIACVICYIFGMIGEGLTVVAYIVLAVTTIPALVTASGLNLLGLHLFVTYYLLMAGITPPVAISAFIAAGVAGARPMQTAWTAVRLAAVLYFIPFFFVFNPALLMQGTTSEILRLFVLCLVGIWILASGLQGYLIKVGRLSMWSRPLYVAGGFLIALPGWQTTIIGAALTAILILVTLITKRTAERKPNR